ncbi:glutathione S-transferase [Hirschia litorea]|uniref:Glutathione S-transferase n=1 Tax=Hirschia litorea TaxID=1199156 RepID=A0ABW2IH03_9PROT
MFTVHHLNNSRSQRVLWLLEELEFTYQIKFYQRDVKTMLAPPELKKVHPLGKSPILQDNDYTIAETGAIFSYLLAKYGNGPLAPSFDTKDGIALQHWLHYAEGSAMPPLLMKLVFDRMPLNTSFLMRPVVKQVCKKAMTAFVQPRLQEHIDYWEKSLSKTGWFAGNKFTAADMIMSFPLEAAASRAGADKSEIIMDFLSRIHARPAYQTALAKGGEYAYAKAQVTNS